MLEALIAAAILIFFLGLVFLNSFLSWEALVIVGSSLTAIGLLVGLPGGLFYHLKLRAELLSLGSPPQRWWLYPTDQHALLRTHQWRRVQPAFLAGAIGFAITILGALVVFLSVFK